MTKETLLKSLLGALLTSVIATQKEKHKRKKDFRSFIDSKVDCFSGLDLKALSQGKLFQLYQESVPHVQTQCDGIVADVPRRNRKQFKALKNSYERLTHEQIEPLAGKFFTLEAYVRNPQATLFPDYNAGILILTSVLNQMGEWAG